MAAYRLDRFARFGAGAHGTELLQKLVATSPAAAERIAALPVSTPKPSTKAPVVLGPPKGTDKVVVDPPVDADDVPESSSKPLTDQEKAEAALEALRQQQMDIETELYESQAEDPGEPDKASPLLYIGLGLGALVLIGGAYFAAKPRASVAGYRRRKKRKSRRSRR